MSTNNWKRWIPAAVIPVVIAGAAIAVPLSANATDSLPTKTPQEVLALVGNSSVTAFSGTVQQTANLGLPELPAGVSSSSLGASGSTSSPTASPSTGSASSTDAASTVSSALKLLTGTHTARVFVDGATSQRVQVLDQMAETDLVRSGSDVWLYDSAKQTAVHSTLPEHSATSSDPSSGATVQTPDQLAQKFLADVDPTTNVSVGGDVTVAGRSAYDLILAPQATDTLVGAVSIAVDSQTGLPLQVSVTARGAADPAFSTGFTDLTLQTPSADLFAFTPPTGTTVTEKTAPAAGSGAGAGEQHAPTDGQKPVVSGTGWDAIVELPAGPDSAALTSSPLLSELTTAVDGGHVLTTTLITVFVTDDGRVFAGSVAADKLQAAAAAQ